jgi:t-SNARE complex subunit (syntaxin)
MNSENFNQQDAETQLRELDAQLAKGRRAARITLALTLLLLIIVIALIISLASAP